MITITSFGSFFKQKFRIPEIKKGDVASFHSSFLRLSNTPVSSNVFIVHNIVILRSGDLMVSVNAELWIG